MAGPAGCTEAPRPKPLAMVNGQPLGLEYFREQSSFMGMGADPTRMTKDLRRAVLEAIAGQMVVIQKAKENGITLTPEELDREETALRRGQSETDFKNVLAAQGLNYKLWRKALHREILVRKTLDLMLASQTKVSPGEIRAYYETHRNHFDRPEQVLAEHVVLPTKELAVELVKRIEEGQELVAAAADLGAAMDGMGQAAWLSRGHMPPALEKKAFTLKPGLVAGPFHSDYGYHVIKVLDKRPAGMLSLKDAAAKIQTTLLQQKKQALAEVWFNKLQSEAKVEFSRDFLETGHSGNTGE